MESIRKEKYPRVSVIVPGHNCGEDIVECLKSVFGLTYPKDKLEVFFVDNHSEDDSIKLVLENFPKVTIIKSKTNLGYAKSINVSSKRAKGDYLLILNADLVVDKNCLKEMMKTIVKSSKNAVVGPKVYEYDRRDVLQTIYGRINKQTLHVQRIGSGQKDRGQYDSEKCVEYVAFCSALVRKNALRKVGWLDENLFVYFEEVDLYLRLAARNWQIIFCPQAKVWHKGGATIGRNSSLVTYYLVRNNLYLKNKLNRFRFLDHLKNMRFLVSLFISSFLAKKKREHWAAVRGVINFYRSSFGQ